MFVAKTVTIKGKAPTGTKRLVYKFQKKVQSSGQTAGLAAANDATVYTYFADSDTGKTYPINLHSMEFT